MASISTLEASSSTSNPHSYQVFLSFRGEDTRRNFTDHLYNTLIAYGIHTFRDDEELEKGEEIKSGLSRAIEGSKIFVIIFSENYATSKWCLNELVKIIEYTTHDQDKKVIPVFYHVKPSDVGHQSESFEDAFFNHEKDANQEKKEMIKKWRVALEKAAKLVGYHVDDQHEAEVIQKICEVIITRLNRKSLHVGDNIVGMGIHLERLKSLIESELDNVHMIGIYGIGGIGKTTIAMAIYNDISSQFDGSSFLRGVGEKSKGGLLELQKKLLKDTLKGQSPELNDPSEGINVIKERLCSKRVLIVLDDVDEIEQLENLAGKHGWYGAKSRIIITTKDISLLNQHGVDQFYEVKELNPEEATELFNWWAFKQNISKPKEDFKSLSNCVVKYAKGLPIALKVLGGFLFGKSIDEWKSALHKLEKIPHMKVQSVLKVSYERLDDIEKSIFLDIACFFKGKDKDFVSRILGRHAEIGIKVLHERCLITISENKLDMHDLLQQMGQEIIRQECLKEPGNRSRLWDPNDVDSVLTRNTGTQAIEGLFVQISTSNSIKFSTNSFTKMNRLRLLKVYHHWSERYFEVDLPKDLEFPSFELTYFHFERYPLESLPTNFHVKNLVELNLKHSRIKQLSKGNEILGNLKVINLSYSKDLVEIPNFSSVPNLEILILEGCRSLESLPRNFHKFEHLRSLFCKNCSKMKSFPEIKGNMSKLREIDLSFTSIEELPYSFKHLKALQHLDLSDCKSLGSLPKSIFNLSFLQTLIVHGCSNLKGFPEIKDDMENLETLDLSCAGIEELPSSIGHLKALKHLDLSDCESLGSLPKSICNLSFLQTLIVQGCSNLKGFPEINGDMENLERLDLREIGIEELPSSIGHLKALKHLDLSFCQNLANLPESICNLSSLETLIVPRCSNLKGFPEINGDMENLERLDLSFTGIEELPSSIGHLKALKHLDLSFCQNLANLPESICNLSSLETLIVPMCSNLKGFPEINGDMENLERLDLSFTGIEELPSSIGHLKALKHLDLSFCQNLANLPESICNLSSLETLIVQGCSNLKDFPEIKDDMENLEMLYTGIEELPSSIRHLKALKHLDLSFCRNLANLLESICNLSSLETLIVKGYSNLKGFPEIKDDMKNLEMLDLSYTGIKELPSSIGHLKALKHLKLSFCQNLANLPESICNLSSLETLIVTFCSNLKGFPEINGDMENLERLDLRGTCIKELPSSIGHLKALKHLNLEYCQNLVDLPESICSLSSLETLIVQRCSNLKGFPEINGDMENLERLDLRETGIKELPSSIGHLKALKHLNLEYCQNLVDLPKSICSLSSLETLIVQRCSNFKGFPEINGDMENLERLDLRETGIKELPSSIGHLKALKHLDLSFCQNLRNLSEGICNLRSLKTLILHRCSNFKGFPEINDDMENLERLDLSFTGIEELPSSIGYLNALKHLNLEYCAELVSLSESICNLCSLKTLKVLQCPKLERLEVKLMGSWDLTCCILKQGVIWWSNHHFSSLKTLNLQNNQMEGEVLNHLVFPLSSLVKLCIRNSRGMERGILSDSFHLSSLEVLSVGNFNPMERGILSDIFLQSSLKTLSLHNCNLMEEGIHCDLWNLSSLIELSLSNCNLMEGEILNHVCHLSSLERLSLDGNHFSCIPAGISQLSNLRGLNLSHCKKLQQIPELPSNLRDLNLSHCKKLQEIPELPLSLRFLYAQCSDGISSSPSLLWSHSLFNGFKSELIQETKIFVGATLFEGKGMGIVIPRSSGIVEGIRNQSMGSDEVTIELPQNWYHNNDLLGFALCCVYVPVVDDESYIGYNLKCELTIGRNYPSNKLDDFRISCWCHVCDDDHSVSDHVWVIFYPKDAIKEQYRSNHWMVVSFSRYLGGKLVEVKECGFHLIYMPNVLNTESNTNAQSSFSTNHLLRENNGFNVKRSRDDAGDHQKEDPYHKRSRHF